MAISSNCVLCDQSNCYISTVSEIDSPGIARIYNGKTCVGSRKSEGRGKIRVIRIRIFLYYGTRLLSRQLRGKIYAVEWSREFIALELWQVHYGRGGSQGNGTVVNRGAAGRRHGRQTKTERRKVIRRIYVANSYSSSLAGYKCLIKISSSYNSSSYCECSYCERSYCECETSRILIH